MAKKMTPNQNKRSSGRGAKSSSSGKSSKPEKVYINRWYPRDEKVFNKFADSPILNRQDLHEQIRVHSHEATLRVKRDGLNNDLVDRIAADKTFGLSKEEILSAMDPILYVGRSPSQVEELITEVIDPIIERHPQKNIETEINL